MKTKKVILKNNFHNSSVELMAKQDEFGYGYLTLSPYQVKRAQKKLCGIKECTCSNELGIRGEQENTWTILPTPAIRGYANDFIARSNDLK